MAPREVPKPTPKLQRSVLKTVGATKGRSSPANVKKSLATVSKKVIEKVPFRMNNTTVEGRQRTNTVPKVTTPKPKENKSEAAPGSVTKSAKKPTWKRRPKPAHSGVPVPEKMKQLLQKQFKDVDDL